MQALRFWKTVTRDQTARILEAYPELHRKVPSEVLNQLL